MRLNLPKVGSFSSRPKKVVWGVAVLVVIVPLVGWAVWDRYYSTKTEPVVSVKKPSIDINDKKAVSRELATTYLNYAEQEVYNKNYDSAVSYFGIAADKAVEIKKYPLAKSILEECLQSVPDSKVPASVYYRLATVAKEQGDTASEKINLQKTLARANQAGSGVYAYQLEAINGRLKELQ